jgi:hypothetical protein
LLASLKKMSLAKHGELFFILASNSFSPLAILASVWKKWFPTLKHPNAYIAIKWNLNLLVITFLTTLMPLARVVLRNDASPSDGDNKRLVCVRRDQCHDHIKNIYPEKSRLMSLQGPLLHSPEWRVTSLVSIHYEEVIFKVK